MTGPNGPVCACCRYACEQPDAEGRCDECHAEAAHEEERAAGYCDDFGADAAGPADDEELAAVAAEANEERTARTQLAAVRAQGRAWL